jgi:septal ring factor EnvC (AmiA/AmiB activator)
MKTGRIFIILLFSLLSVSALAQKSRSQLEREKQENLKKIREANKILEQTQSKKKSTLAQLTVIKKEIEARNNLINSISQEVELLTREIGEVGSIIIALESDVVKLKKEYADMIYQASKNQGNFDRLTFIFSAETFNQLVMRLKYFRQFSDARKYQVEQIQKVMASLASEKVRLNKIFQEKNDLLEAKQIETETLNSVKKEHDALASSLSKQEKQLKKEVAEREKENKKLEKLIEDIVRREIEKARREAERKARETDRPVTKGLSPEAAELSSSFSANARKLPWPVAHGQIVGHFGKQPHPVLKGVTVDNLGVEILTLKDEPVRAVFDGKVVTIATVPGMNYVVMVQHGEFYTVYARLKSVPNVKNGQEVKARDVIGEVYTDKDGQSQLQFQVWQNSQKLDPEDWLYNR